MERNQEFSQEGMDFEFPAVAFDGSASEVFPSFDEEPEEVLLLEEEEQNEEAMQQEVINEEAISLSYVKKEYEEKISHLNELLAKLKNPISILDEEIIDLMQDIVKKVVKKIIHHEVSQDPHLIKEMIEELCGALDEKNGMVEVAISSDDYANMIDEEFKESLQLHQLDSLKSGDIIIKSNFTEIRALLNDRIEQLVRVQHD